eukprot:643509-Hanusia_phi.AAC.1
MEARRGAEQGGGSLASTWLAIRRFCEHAKCQNVGYRSTRLLRIISPGFEKQDPFTASLTFHLPVH